MPDSDQISHNGLTSVERTTLPDQSEGSLNDTPTIKSLIPKNLSHNKKAVIERLITLHLSQAA